MLRALLALQGAAAIAIGYAAARLFGVHPAALALALGLGVVLLVRLLITANNFVLSARFASATPARFRLGPAARVRLFAEEFAATMLHSSWFMARARARTRIYRDSPVPPILLLHGYGCNSGYWSHLTPILDAARISHASVDLEPVMADIDAYVPLVHRRIEDLCAEVGTAQVLIVAHSMGGLVARAYLRAHGGARVAHVFTLGTPHHGTALANFGIGPNAAQMRREEGAAAPESAWLRALAASESAATRAKFTSLYTHHDNIIAPQTSSFLPGARNIEMGGVGHVALAGNARVLAILVQEIAMMFTR